MSDDVISDVRRRMNVLRDLDAAPVVRAVKPPPTDTEWEEALQVWCLIATRDAPRAVEELRRRMPDVEWSLPALLQRIKEDDWRSKADSLVFYAAPALLREDVNNLIALRRKAITTLDDIVTGRVQGKEAFSRLSAAREILNRVGMSDRLTEPLQPQNPPRLDAPIAEGEDVHGQVRAAHAERMRKLRGTKR